MHFDHLLPNTIFETVEAEGLRPTGVLIPLNSYENRVYEIKLEEDEPIVAKYYRPERWSLEQISEEHRFLAALTQAEVPVVAPRVLKARLKACASLGKTREEGIYYALFPKFRGREHSEITNDDRRWLGRLLARLHNIGESFPAKARWRLTPETYGTASLAFILSQEFLPGDLKESITLHLDRAIELTRPYFKADEKVIALHGDCHPGNILWNKEGPHLVDFDDMVVAAPVQDLWMLFNGSDEERREQQRIFFEGYEVFRKFDPRTLILSEPLRTLRMIRYAAWIGERYTEPVFQKAFPYYQERRYWEGFLQSIREQIALLQELTWN